MQQKLLAAATTLAITSIATPVFAQFTLSAGVQGTRMDVESESQRMLVIPNNKQSTIGPDTTTLLLDDSENNESTNVGGELAAGYQFNFANNLNIALEIFGQLSNTQVDTPVFANGSALLITKIGIPAQDATASFNWIAGLRARPGYYMTPKTRLFLDGGIVWGGFELEQAADVVNFFNVNLPADFDRTETETLVGWRYGAGIEYKLTPSFVIGVDYIITEFEEFTSDTVEDFATFINSQLSQGGGSLTANSEYQSTLHTAGLNFKYLFGASKVKPPQRYYEMRDK